MQGKKQQHFCLHDWKSSQQSFSTLTKLREKSSTKGIFPYEVNSQFAFGKSTPLTESLSIKYAVLPSTKWPGELGRRQIHTTMLLLVTATGREKNSRMCESVGIGPPSIQSFNTVLQT